MTARASIATIFLTMALVSLAGAMTSLINSKSSIEYPFWFFVLFFMMLRTKMYLDDLRDFKTAPKLRWGIVIGIISWFFWVLSAANIRSIEESAGILALAIFVATVALLYTCIVNGFKRMHYGWFLLNIIYMTILLVLWAGPGICLLWKAGILIIGIVTTVIDFYISDSLAIIDEMK